MDKTIVNFCPTGMVPTKAMTPHVPISAPEIVDAVLEASAVGITIAHLHARLDDGSPTSDPAFFAPIVDDIRKHAPNVVVCLTTSGRDCPDFERRSAVIELRPDMCSLTLSSLNFVGSASVNAPDTIQRLARKMDTFRVLPELECFDLGMINYGRYLVAKQIVREPLYWNLLFGNIAGMQSDLASIGLAVAQVPPGSMIALGGLGDHQLPVTAHAIAAGLGVRVGLEDNLWLDRGRRTLATNLDLVRRTHALMAIHERPLLTGAEFRAMAGIAPTTAAAEPRRTASAA